MAKDDKSKIFNTSMDLSKQAGTQFDTAIGTASNRSDTTWDRGTEDYNKAFAGYSDYAGGSGLTPADQDRIRAAYAKIGTTGFGGGGGGGAHSNLTGPSAYTNLNSAYANAYRPDYGESDTGFRKLSSASGGFDQGQLDQIYGNVGRLTDIGQTGGITDEDKANINRASILDQEKTGGYSDQDKALIRAKSSASSPAYFSALKDNLQRQRGVSGNLANAGAVDFKGARAAAQQQAQDRISSEVGLQESIRAGRQQAGDFLSQQGMSLAGLRTANEMAAARSAGDLGLSTQEGITQNQLQGLKGLQESQTGLGQWGLGQAGGLDQFGLNKAGGLDQYSVNQAQLDMQAQGINASSGAASAALAQQAAGQQADAERWLTEYGNTQKQYGIGGLESLYNTNLGASQNYTGQQLQGLGAKFGTQGSLLGLAAQNRGNTLGENVSKGAKIAAAAAATYFSGGAAAPMLASAIGSNAQQGGGGGYVDPRTGAASGAADYLNRDFYRAPTGGQPAPSMSSYNFASNW